MKGYIVVKEKLFYDFENQKFIEEWNSNCITSNFENINQFLDNEDITIRIVPETITNYLMGEE